MARPWKDPNKEIPPMISFLTVTVKGSAPMLVQVEGTPKPGETTKWKHETATAADPWQYSRCVQVTSGGGVTLYALD
jgi:hypothetical protein